MERTYVRIRVHVNGPPIMKHRPLELMRAVRRSVILVVTSELLRGSAVRWREWLVVGRKDVPVCSCRDIVRSDE
jgi:hypothetical protein